MEPERRMLLLEVAATSETVTFQKRWPFAHLPRVGEFVSVRVPGWGSPFPVAARKIWWEPDESAAGGTTWVLLHSQRALTDNPTVAALVAFYHQYGWSPYMGPAL